MTLITAVFLARQAGIVPDRFRYALRKSQRAGATDLSWHRHKDWWQADDISEPERVESMLRVLGEISN